MLQNNQVLSFFRASERGDWNQRELAEFYRVEDALTKSGVAISTDRGLTDEGEPWFVFCRQDDEEVIVHFARIGGEYVVASNFTEAVFRGRNFQTLVRELLDSRPYVLPHSSRSTVFLHPAALLAALVVTAYVKSSELNAAAEDGSRPEKSFGWFLNRHDLAATYSAIVIASVWDSLAIDSSASKPSDDFASLDHAQPAHGEHGPDIQQAFVSDSLLQNIQLFQGADDRSVLTAALDLDGQDAVHNVNGPAIAGLVASASSLHPESSHYDNAAASSAHDVFRAEESDSKLADFGPQQGDFPIAASEQVERTVTHNPVSSSAPSNPTPDHPASQHNSTAPTTDGTSTGEPAAQAKHGTSTGEPAAQAKHGTSTGEPADQAKHVTSTNEPAAEAKHSNEPADQAKHGTTTGEPAAEAKHVTSTGEPADQANQVTSTGEPAAEAKHVTTTGEPADEAKHGTSIIEPAAEAEHSSEPADQATNVTSTNEPAAEAKHSNEPAVQAKHGTSTGEPAAQAKHGTSTGEPAAQANHGTSTGEPAAEAKHGTSTGEPAAEAKHGTSTNEPAAEAKHSNEPADQAKHGTTTGEPAAEANHGTSTSEPADQANHGTSTGEPADQANHGTSTGEPADQAKHVTSTASRPITANRHVGRAGRSGEARHVDRRAGR